MDEADRLDRGQAGRREPVDELGAHGRLEHALLVLEPVARADVTDGHLHGGLGYAPPWRIPVFAPRHVYAAVDPADAVEAVRAAFVDHARGDWLMPSKVYVPAPPDGDFRAMPAARRRLRGAEVGHLLPAEPRAGPPDRERHRPPLRRRRRAPPAPSSTRARSPRSAPARRRCSRPRRSPAEDGPGCRRRVRRQRPSGRADVPGSRPRGPPLGRATPSRRPRSPPSSAPRRAASTGGGAGRGHRRHRHAGPRDPLRGREPPPRPARQPHGRRRARQGRDRGRGARPRPRRRATSGSRRATTATSARAVEAGALGRDDVAELGRILLGEEEGRAGDDEITVFDSTGLAVQDLAVAVARLRALPGGHGRPRVRRRRRGRAAVAERSRDGRTPRALRAPGDGRRPGAELLRAAVRLVVLDLGGAVRLPDDERRR